MGTITLDWLTFAQAQERLLTSQIPTAQVLLALYAYQQHLTRATSWAKTLK